MKGNPLTRMSYALRRKLRLIEQSRSKYASTAQLLARLHDLTDNELREAQRIVSGFEKEHHPMDRAHRANAARGKAFTFHGSFASKILAARRERATPGSFVYEKDGRYYVLKPKKIRAASAGANPSAKRAFVRLMRQARVRPLTGAERGELSRARAALQSGRGRAAAKNPTRAGNRLTRMGPLEEIRYQRDHGKEPGFYKHAFDSHPTLYYDEEHNVIVAGARKDIERVFG